MSARTIIAPTKHELSAVMLDMGALFQLGTNTFFVSVESSLMRVIVYVSRLYSVYMAKSFLVPYLILEQFIKST